MILFVFLSHYEITDIIRNGIKTYTCTATSEEVIAKEKEKKNGSNVFRLFQMAKKPATKAKIAATPPFATKESADDEVVEDAAEDVEVAGVDAVVALLVDDAEPDPVALDPARPVPVVVDVDTVLEAPTEPMAVVAVENGIELGVALGPVGERLAVERIKEWKNQNLSFLNNNNKTRTRTAFLGL
jgi:hypothetical protein